VTILPDYSVAGDPLVRAGTIVHRPIADDTAVVSLLSLRHSGRPTPAVRALEQLLVQHARTYRGVPAPESAR
jgi:hypothetical protein